MKIVHVPDQPETQYWGKEEEDLLMLHKPQYTPRNLKKPADGRTNGLQSNIETGEIQGRMLNRTICCNKSPKTVFDCNIQTLEFKVQWERTE